MKGLGEGVVMPAMQAMIAKWIPMDERAFLATIIFAGLQNCNISLRLALDLLVALCW